MRMCDIGSMGFGGISRLIIVGITFGIYVFGFIDRFGYVGLFVRTPL